MSSYEGPPIVEGTRVERYKPVSTVSIFVDDKAYFAHVKSIMMKTSVKITDAEVLHDLIQDWFYKRNDAS